MGGRADGQTHLHRIAYADALEEGRQDDRADDAGDDNRNRGDGGYAAFRRPRPQAELLPISAREKVSCFRSDRTDG